MSPRGRWQMPLLLGTVFALALALGVMLPRLGPWARRPEPAVPWQAAAAVFERLERAEPWIQHPLAADSLRGHVRVIVLWSESDPRAMRVLPDAEAWHRAYGRFGVQVVAVHVPQFAFAADLGVPQRIARRLGLTLPLVTDPSYRLTGELGRSLEGPEILVADRSGRVLLQASGAGSAAVDRVIRDAIGGPDLPENPVPETYASSVAARTVHLGTSRVEGGPLADADPGRTRVFTAQFRFQEEGRAYVPYPVGRWTPVADALIAAREGADSYLSIRGAGRHVWAVMAPPPSGSGRVWILRNEEWVPREFAGADIEMDARGSSYVDVTEPRLYDLARCPDGCTLKLSPGTQGVALHALVFEDPPAK